MRDSNLRLFDVYAAGGGHQVHRSVVHERPDRVPALELVQATSHGSRGLETGVRGIQLEVAAEARQAKTKTQGNCREENLVPAAKVRDVAHFELEKQQNSKPGADPINKIPE